MKYVIFSSYGNDSLALVMWAYQAKLDEVIVAYSDTGWAAPFWAERADKARGWIAGLGFENVTLESEGMESLIRRKKAWPRGGGGKFQFCTKALKEEPAAEWLDNIDPHKELTCMIGIRREESRNRATFPEWTTASEKHGGRELWAPLVRHTADQRNELLGMAGFRPLNHRSRECYPCVNANKQELKLLDQTTIKKIELLEVEMGTNSKGNERVMFSPKRHGGAVGIRAVAADADKGVDDLFGVCDAGWCGD